MLRWLDDAIVYEIYPVSFYDSNGDGRGDLNGVTEKIPYLKELGINTVWMNPFFKGPFRDAGYDISDYCAVDSQFGTIEDFRAMAKALHDNGIRLIIDLVIGHTSDEHPWFLESRKRNPNPKYKDYYIWTEDCFTNAPDSIKGIAPRDGNYIVNYYAFQPALNYGYGEVNAPSWQMKYTDERLTPLRNEIINIIKFWIDQGADGFRVDMAGSLVKNDPNGEGIKWVWNKIITEVKAYAPECCFMSEWGNSVRAIESGFDFDYLCHATDGYNQIFRSEPMSNIMRYHERFGNSYFCENGKGSMQEFLRYTKILHSLEEKGGFSLPSGFHDVIRIAAQKSINQLKCIFAFILTYKTIPQIYYGDEIGIKHNFKVHKDGGYVRTGARTPMQWNESAHRGFTTARRVYLPTDNRKTCSVEYQKNKEDSLWNTVRVLNTLHTEHKALHYSGDLKVLQSGYPLVYIRKSDKERIFVAINPSSETQVIDCKAKTALLSNICNFKDGKLTLNKESFFIGRL